MKRAWLALILVGAVTVMGCESDGGGADAIGGYDIVQGADTLPEIGPLPTDTTDPQDDTAGPGPDVATGDDTGQPNEDVYVEPDVPTTTDTGGGERDCTDAELQDFNGCLDGCASGDTACAQACFGANLSTACQEAYVALLECADTNGCGDNTTCISENCPDEVAAVFGDIGGGESQVYGTVTVDFSTDYVRNAENGQQDAAGVLQTAFTTGTFGSTNTPVSPAAATQFQTAATYYAEANGSGVEVSQIGISGQSALNPIVVVAFDGNSIATGTHSAGLTGSDTVQLFVADVNWAAGTIQCVHAFAVGSLDVTAAGDVTNHGNLAFSGTIDLYHPTDVYGQDISSQLSIPVCAAQ